MGRWRAHGDVGGALIAGDGAFASAIGMTPTAGS